MIQIIRERKVHEGIAYRLCFDLIVNGKRTTGGFAFPCTKDGKVDETKFTSPDNNYHKCLAGEHNVSPSYVRAHQWQHVEPAIARCDSCGGEAEMDPSCGAYVCSDCSNHLGLARCYCGWSASGGNGYSELVEMGETIDEG
jgi:hypothetical protein